MSIEEPESLSGNNHFHSHPRTLAEMRGFFICQNIQLLLTFSLPWVKRKKLSKPINRSSKLGVTEEGSSMIGESKEKVRLPKYKSGGLFLR